MSKSNLNELVTMRLKIKELEKVIASIMPDCIEEAMNAFCKGKNATVFDNPKAKIIFKQVKEYGTPKNNGDLFTLDFEINKELDALKTEHWGIIEDIEKGIQYLEEKKQSFMTNDKITALRNEYEETKKQTYNLKPQLAVTIK